MKCPACWRDINTNAGGRNLDVHRDKAGRPCQGSGFPINRYEEIQ